MIVSATVVAEGAPAVVVIDVLTVAEKVPVAATTFRATSTISRGGGKNASATTPVALTKETITSSPANKTSTVVLTATTGSIQRGSSSKITIKPIRSNHHSSSLAMCPGKKAPPEPALHSTTAGATTTTTAQATDARRIDVTSGGGGE